MNLNRAFILGNVTRQPEVKALPSGQSVTTFGVATNRFYKDNTGTKKQDTEFHNVVAFGKLADICAKFLNKGSMVLVEGRIKTRSWQNASGIRQYRTEIISENIQLAPKTMQGSSAPEPETPRSEEIPIIEESYTPPAKDVPDEGDIDVKDIPF